MSDLSLWTHDNRKHLANADEQPEPQTNGTSAVVEAESPVDDKADPEIPRELPILPLRGLVVLAGVDSTG